MFAPEVHHPLSVFQILTERKVSSTIFQETIQKGHVLRAESHIASIACRSYLAGMPVVRSAPQTADSLRSIAAALKEAAGTLEGYALAVEVANFGTIEVTNDKQREDGLKFVDGYVAAVRKAITAAREARGDFQGSR